MTALEGVLLVQWWQVCSVRPINKDHHRCRYRLFRLSQIDARASFNTMRYLRKLSSPFPPQNLSVCFRICLHSLPIPSDLELKSACTLCNPPAAEAPYTEDTKHTAPAVAHVVEERSRCAVGSGVSRRRRHDKLAGACRCCTRSTLRSKKLVCTH